MANMHNNETHEVHFPSTYIQGGVIKTTIAKADNSETPHTPTVRKVEKVIYVPTELEKLQAEAAELRRYTFNAIPPLPSYIREEYRLRLMQVEREIALLEVEQFKAQLEREQEQYEALMAELPALAKAEAEAHAAFKKAEQIHDNTAALLDNAHGRERNHRIRIGQLKRKLEELNFFNTSSVEGQSNG